MGNMREISIEECNAVFGGTGEIVVSGRRPVPGSTNFAGTYGPVYNSSMLPAGIMSSYEDIYDPDGDDDGDGDRNMDEEIVVSGLDESKLGTMRDQANWMAPILIGLVVVGTGSLGASAGKYALQILTSLVGSTEASAIIATVGSAVGEQYAQELLADKLYKGMRDRYIQDMGDDGVYNQSWRSLD